MQEYFVFMMVKDSLIWAFQVIYGDLTGFWSAILIHLITSLVDFVVLFGMSIWGAILLSQSDVLECTFDASCNNFYSIAKANMIAGFCYSFWLLFLKQIVVCIGLHYWGFREIERDEKALKDKQIKELGDSNISGMHSTLYNRLKPARAPSLYLDDLESDEGARSKSSHR